MSKPTTTPTMTGAQRPIARGELEDRLRSLRSEVDTVKSSTQGAVVAGGIGALLILLLLAFLVGKAKAKKKYAFVEIRRV